MNKSVWKHNCNIRFKSIQYVCTCDSWGMLCLQTKSYAMPYKQLFWMDWFDRIWCVLLWFSSRYGKCFFPWIECTNPDCCLNVFVGNLSSINVNEAWLQKSKIFIRAPYSSRNILDWLAPRTWICQCENQQNIDIFTSLHWTNLADNFGYTLKNFSFNFFSLLTFVLHERVYSNDGDISIVWFEWNDKVCRYQRVLFGFPFCT